MKIRKLLHRTGVAAAFLTAALTAAGLVHPLAAVNGAGLDTIDMSRKCSIHIYKYDQAISTSLPDATGERDTGIETVMQEHAVKGVEFTILRVGDIQTKTESVNGTEEVQVVYSLPAELAETNLGISAAAAVSVSGQSGKSYYSSDIIMHALAAKLNTNRIATKNALTAYTEKYADQGVKVVTDDNGTAEVSGLPIGLFLITETAVPQNITGTTNPFFVSLPTTNTSGDQFIYDLYVYPKNQNDTPVIDKLIKTDAADTYEDSGTASVGDLVSYRVVTKVPEISDRATYYSAWSITDTITDGLDYVDITDKSKVTVQAYDDGQAAAQDGTVSASLSLEADDYDIAYTAGARTVTVSLNQQGLAKLNRPENSGKYIVFAYQARINSLAVLGDAGAAGTGNDNTAALTWSRSNTSHTQTIRDTARVYAYALDVTKLLSDHPENAAALLPTVEFTLFDETRNRQVNGDLSGGSTYKVNGTHTADFIFRPDEKGRLNIEGLAAGIYTLTEVKSASGYALLKAPITIVITETEAAAVAEIAGHNDRNEKEKARGAAASITTSKAATAEVDGNAVSMTERNGSAHAAVNIEITNTKTWIPYLPQTGGTGTLLLVLVGAVLLGTGFLMARIGKLRSKVQKSI